MTTLEVKCTVSDCFFHAQGNICRAEKIEIDMDYQVNKKNQAEFASDFDLKARLGNVLDSTNTCCKTFRSKKTSPNRPKM